jgi:hypothetical protein
MEPDPSIHIRSIQTRVGLHVRAVALATTDVIETPSIFRSVSCGEPLASQDQDMSTSSRGQTEALFNTLQHVPGRSLRRRVQPGAGASGVARAPPPGQFRRP